MSELQVEIRPTPEVAPARRRHVAPVRIPGSLPDRDPMPAPEPAASEQPAAAADTGAPGAPTADAGQQVVPEAKAPPARTRRGRRGVAPTTVITVPWESDLPGISSADIRVELARRERRAAKLLAERERVIQAMEAIEAALDAIGE